MSLTFLSKPIGLVTQILMASFFGAGIAFDSYILSFFLVNFLSNTLSRVFSAVAIPYLTELRKSMGEHELNAFVMATLTVFCVPMLVFAVVMVAAPGAIVSLGAPNAPEETRQLSTAMLRFMAIPAVFMLFVELMKSILNYNEAFRIPTSMPIVNSITTFLMVLIGHTYLGIWALPAAFALSYLFQAAFIGSFAVRRGLVVFVQPRASRSLLATLWSRSWMVLVSTVILVVNLFVDKVFASGMAPGSVSSIAYSRALEGFGMQVFAFSLVSVMFTRTARLVAESDFFACDEYVRSNIVRLVRLVVPVCLAVALASHEVVFVLYERNAFGPDDTMRTAGVLAMYMVGLPAFLTNMVVANIFHALGRFRDKIWLAVQFLVSNVAGNMLLMGPLKVMGLAVSSSIAINLHLFLSLWILSRYRLGIDGGLYARIVIEHYVLGLLAWIGYQGLAAAGAVPAMSDGPSRFEATALGVYKIAIVLFVFAGLSVAWRHLRRMALRGKK